MSKSQNKASDKKSNWPHDIGYGKPPKDKQFKKGQSGNPSGRPRNDKKHKSVSRMIRDVLMTEVEGSVNGKRCRMSRLEAILARQVALALTGDIRSAKFVLAHADKHVPDHLSLEELMEGRSVIEFTAEDVARFDKARLVEGMQTLNKEQAVELDAPPKGEPFKQPIL